ncbi:MAG TPA: diacylglycerol kinase family protein [Candidatus Acidoferrum sp.]|nr:diacylglycerol kinase family protein [Candidatus Acidoferrum sp.]
MKPRFLAIVNPAAGGGRCGRLADAALNRVREAGVELEIARTGSAGEATSLSRAAYERGIRNFLAVGGDGTAYEILNGIFPQSLTDGRVALGLLPLGTGNSFLKDFSSRGVEHTIDALKHQSRRACDVIRLSHTDGDIYFLNLVSLGFPADVGALTNRRFKRLGELGYILGVFTQLARLEHLAFPHRLDEAGEWDFRPCLFLSFSNSKFTGGKMMIAPNADPTDGKIEYVRWGPIGRAGLIATLPRLFTGTHIKHPLASRAAARRVELDLGGPVNALVDGEILRLNCRSLEILPAALDVYA